MVPIAHPESEDALAASSVESQNLSPSWREEEQTLERRNWYGVDKKVALADHEDKQSGRKAMGFPFRYLSM